MNVLGILDCGGRAQRRPRFWTDGVCGVGHAPRAHEGGVALRFPPQSMTSKARESMTNFCAGGPGYSN